MKFVAISTMFPKQIGFCMKDCMSNEAFFSACSLACFDITEIVAGLPIADPKKISGVHKRCWKYLPGVVKASESSPNLTSPTDSGEKVEVQAS